MPETKIEKQPRTFRDYLIVWGPVVLLITLGFWLAWQFVEPAPPRTIRIATGSEDGGYAAAARRYQALLADNKIDLQILYTAGSIENLALLRAGKADIGFVQGGTTTASDSEHIQSLASVFYEPLWVFHRDSLNLDYLSQLKGKRISIGPEGSGTAVLAEQLLPRNGVSPDNTEIVKEDARTAADKLKAGRLDALFQVASADSRIVRELAVSPGVDLMSFRRHLAYERRYSYLSTVTLGEGTADLVRNIPPADKVLLAPAAILVARDDLHPALVPLLLSAATRVHEQGGTFEKPLEFPSSRYTELPMGRQARNYLKSGPSFLYDVFPFWVAVWIDRLKIMLLPFLTLMVPLIKLAPPVYRWRIRSKIYRWYSVLREVERKAFYGKPSPGFREELGQLDEIDLEISDISVPAAYMEEFYNLRMHLGLLRTRLEERARPGEQTPEVAAGRHS